MYIEVKNLNKNYGDADNMVKVLQDISFCIEKGSICTILGPSGSGKSTLLNILGGLENADSGEVMIGDTDILKLNSKKLSLFRRKNFGFVFQFYNLIPNLTVRENVEVCEYLSEEPLSVDELFGILGMAEHQKKFPRQISGGQQQRTALARALSKNPSVLLCDEPTGALDYKASKELLELLEQINKRYNTTIIIVTHNMAIADMSDQVLTIRDGKIAKNIKNDNRKSAAEIEW
ncbi:ABC transporter ATP-binding protein [Mediterraneibacter gnavus]|jgi:putative ABC transport system ATP-binding protein|uniref:ABC transporter ATP-binding protein n=1 Tax=Mediterraneibacter gnavus TaxID=33038 RepID=A0A2N5P5P3_MEDGN|nr:ABC transporter ATP-binding protein [Mediterraneibacter gnavus]PLT70448.1 ABC transporter ATP-binding protein [Mediterraneibacter gnavus]